jgi:hypothetical protein
MTHVTNHADFVAFRDLSTAETVGVELTWTIIVRFPGSNVPEKQEIRFVARTDNLNKTERQKNRYRAFAELLELRDEEVLADIYYSNITWGEDLLQLIAGHIATFFKPRNNILFALVALVLRLNNTANPFFTI